MKRWRMLRTRYRENVMKIFEQTTCAGIPCYAIRKYKDDDIPPCMQPYELYFYVYIKTTKKIAEYIGYECSR